MPRDAMAELGNFTAALEGIDLQLEFDPGDAEAVHKAIAKMEAVIDAAADPFPGNELIAQVVEQLKEHYRQAIREESPEDDELGSEA
ncbi:hypothetical protein D9599_25775 [Roseomonas sp. KE2513]|uniref:hypothetical protein n=1 Tax=Roseomonas sp. KE2513 TaxID=2479202 RepID=UPI0018DFABE7|nr:hypothetical protein [Roseomonas sp. KE2513]MBI0538967.1 hypothetical protein [Roseomonas sp. KE2513]